MRPRGLCPKCLEIAVLTKHHCFPKRFFPNQPKPVCLWICRTCHDELERLIPYRRKMPRNFYLDVAKHFLGRANDESLGYRV